MSRLGARFARFAACSNGATAIEYAMIGAGISILILVAMTTIGGSVADLFASLVSVF